MDKKEQELAFSEFEVLVGKMVNKGQSITAPVYLSAQIIKSIEKKKKFRAFFKMSCYGLATLVSGVGLFLVWHSVGASIINSEAGSLFSLLFSDFNIVANYWHDYLLSLLQSLPVVSLLSLVILVWLMLTSLWAGIRTYLSFNYHFINHN